MMRYTLPQTAKELRDLIVALEKREAQLATYQADSYAQQAHRRSRRLEVADGLTRARAALAALEAPPLSAKQPQP